MDIEKTVSKKVSYEKGYKYFIDYKDWKVIPLCVKLLQMSAHARNFDETRSMSFLIEDHELLEKYNIIWNKVSNSIKKDFDGKHVNNKKYLKTKIKS